MTGERPVWKVAIIGVVWRHLSGLGVVGIAFALGVVGFERGFDFNSAPAIDLETANLISGDF